MGENLSYRGGDSSDDGQDGAQSQRSRGLFNPDHYSAQRKEFLQRDIVHDLPSFRHDEGKLPGRQREGSLDNSSLPGGSSVSKWREGKDPLTVQQLDKLFKFKSVHTMEIDEMVRWKSNDVKGMRSTNYIKKMTNQNDNIMKVTDLDRLEKLQNFSDGLPCLNFRKSCMKVQLLIVMACEQIIKHKMFETISISIILLNCVTLAMEDPTQKEETQADLIWEYTFQGLYTVEMMFKIIGLGFFMNKGAYLRDAFNILDFVIIMSAYVTICQPLIESALGIEEQAVAATEEEEEGLSLSSLRAFRVLRPLRAVTSIKGLRILIQSVLTSLPRLQASIVVLIFFYIIFAIAGVNLFSGMLKQRCVNYATGREFEGEDGEPYICGGGNICPEGYFCGKMNVNPNFEVTNFDNIFWALLVVFQCITLEGWSDVQMMYQQAYTYAVFFYFVPLVFIGAFFLLNLVLAVINYSFVQEQEKAKEEERRIAEERNKLKRKKDDDDMEDAAKHDSDDDIVLGVGEFFLAQKAAKMMLHWLEKEGEEQEKRQKEAEIAAEEAENAARIAAERKQKIRDQQKNPKPVQRRDAVSSSFHAEKQIDGTEMLKQLGQRHSLKRQHTKKLSPGQLPLQMPNYANSNGQVDPGQEFSVSSSGMGSESFDANGNAVIDEANESEHEAKEAHEQRVAAYLKGLNDEESEQQPGFRSIESQQAHILYKGKTLKDHQFSQAERKSSGGGRASTVKSKNGAKTAINWRQEERALDMAIIADQRATPEPRNALKSGGGQQLASSGKKRIKKNFHNTQYAPSSPFEAGESGILKDENRVQKELAIDNFIQPVHSNQDKSLSPEAMSEGEHKNMRDDESEYFDFQPQEYDYLDLEEHATRKQKSEGGALKSVLDSEENSSIIGSDILSEDAKEFGFTKKGSVDPRWNSKGLEANYQRQADSSLGFPTKSPIIRPKRHKMRSQQDQSESTGLAISKAHLKKISERRGTRIMINKSNHNQTMKSTQFDPNAENGETHNYEEPKPDKKKGMDNCSEKLDHQQKKKIINIYDNFDMSEFKPAGDKYQFMKKKKEFAQKKICSNPRVFYKSTSHQEVFEIRDKERERTGIKQINRFIEVQNATQGSCESDDDIDFTDIRPMCQPWQLKTTYKIADKQEVEVDDDDEDYLLFAAQPFETAMNIGHSDMLSHLDTQFFTRRSDIIVSSTLSITLTPTMEELNNDKKKDEGQFDFTSHGESVEKKQQTSKFALMTDKEVTAWIDKRQKFRSLFRVECVKFKDKTYHDRTASVISLVESDQEFDAGTVNSDEEQQDDIADNLSSSSPGGNSSNRFLNVYSQPRRKLIPANLLSEELPEKIRSQMAKHEKKMYRQWVQNFTVSKTKKNKAENSGEGKLAQRLFSLEEAIKLETGMYHKDDDEKAPGQQTIDPDSVNKTIFVGNREQLYEEQQFEDKIQDVKGNNDVSVHHNFKGDCIPEHLRNELNLPNAEEMEGMNIDFDEVRLMDAGALSKNKTFIWSGQDVLDASMKNSLAAWTVAHLNKLRVWPLAIFGLVKKARCLLKMFVRTTLFENFMTLSVLLNTIVMAMDSYGIDKELEKTLEEINQVFTWIFICEMSFKLLAIGPKKYCAEPMNNLDGAVVMLSIIEIVIGAVGGESGGGSLQAFRTIRVFRTFRVLRVTRLLRALQQMQVIVAVVQKSFMSFFYITCLLFIFVFIYALLGMQFFGGLYNFDDGEKPRGNFDTFWIAFVTVFQVLTMENWQDNLFQSMRTSTPKPITAVFYISWIFVGNIVLLNLFLAILLDAFVSENDATEITEEELEAERLAEEKQKQLIEEEKERRRRKLAKTRTKKMTMDDMMEEQAKVKRKKKTKNFKGKAQDVDDIEDLEANAVKKLLEDKGLIQRVEKFKWYQKDLPDHIECENSLYIFPKTKGSKAKLAKFRRFCYNLQGHKLFDRVIMALIFLSSMKLATDTYMTEEDFSKDHPTQVIGGHVDSFFTWVFFAESLTKIIALGLIMDGESYLRDGWSQLDFFIVVTSLIDFALQGVEIPAIKILRLLRTLRPLRVISHDKSLRLIVTALFGSMGAIVQVAIVILVVWLMFAIFGISTYKGNFFYCSKDMYFYHGKQTCEEAGGQWMVWDSNFDDIGQAMLTLFIVSSLEGWPNIMYQALDIVGLDKGPLLENQPYQAGFFILFILVGSFFLLNFFIGVLFLKYTQADRAEKKGFTDEHLDWMEMQSMILKARVPHATMYRPPAGTARRWMFDNVINHRKGHFDTVIMGAIVLNMVQMALAFEGSSGEWNAFLDVTNYIFTATFFIEAVLKLFVFHAAYFHTGWNKFDFFVVIASLFDIAMKFLPQGGDSQFLQVVPQLARVFRVLRVSRVLRLAGQSKNLQALMQTIERSVQSIVSVFLLLMLIFFMFATLGVFFFSDITEGGVIDPDYKNFKRFGDGFLLLFAVSTGEAWNEIMYDCYLAPDDCTPGVDCGTPFAPAYFISFIMIVTHVMLNLFILVIIEQFERFYLNTDSALVQFKAADGTLERYIKAWEKKARLCKQEYLCQVIRERDLLDLYSELSNTCGALGPAPGTKPDEMKKKILTMKIQTENGFVHFNELLYRLMRDAYGGRSGEVFSLTPVMQVTEIVTQYKLDKLACATFQKIFKPTETQGSLDVDGADGGLSRQKTKRKAKEEAGNSFLASKDRANKTAKSVNPFLTHMFFKISFASWRHVVKRYLDDHGIHSPPSGSEQHIEIAEPKVEQDGIKIEYNKYETEKYTSSEEDVEEDISPSKSVSQHPTEKRQRRRKTNFTGAPLSPISGHKTEDLVEDSCDTSRAAKSPEVHRKIAKKLRTDAKRRLSSLDAFALPGRLSLLKLSSPSKKSPMRNVNAQEISVQDSVSPTPDIQGTMSKKLKLAEPPLSGRSPKGGLGMPHGSQGLSASIVEEGDEEIDAPVSAVDMMKKTQTEAKKPSNVPKFRANMK